MCCVLCVSVEGAEDRKQDSEYRVFRMANMWGTQRESHVLYKIPITQSLEVVGVFGGDVGSVSTGTGTIKPITGAMLHAATPATGLLGVPSSSNPNNGRQQHQHQFMVVMVVVVLVTI